MPDTAAAPHADRGHSKLGASGAERWMNCPGSVSLLAALGIQEDTEDPSYRREGTTMHEVAEVCLRTGGDAWEHVGEVHEGITVDQPMADAVQVYLDYVRQFMFEGDHQWWVEAALSSPLHADMFGTLDFASLHDGAAWLRVVDLKGGVGILVDPDDNPQLKYYGYLLIEKHPEWPDDMPVILAICQPRGFHPDGKIREWMTTAGEIREWVHDTLVPAMCKAEYDGTLDAGPWCRFCPAKLICPMLTGLYRAAATCDPQEIIVCDDATVARNYRQIQAVQFYVAALKKEALRRALGGAVFPEGTIKMVQKKADRVMPEDAQKEAFKQFGNEVMTKPTLMGPAAMEKVSPAAAKFVAEHAFKPNTGYTIALAEERGVAVPVPKISETFKAAIDKLTSEG